MPHHPLTRLLQQAFAACVSAQPESLSRWESRRRFLRNASAAAGGLLLSSLVKGVYAESFTGADAILEPPAHPAAVPGQPASRIAIIGAGIAGLNAAWQLKQQGIPSTVYEASGRAGGRMYTLKDHFGPGLTTDVGGEFVDTTHTDILALLQQLDLPKYDLREDTLIPKTFWFEGRLHSDQELRDAIAPYVPRLMQDIHSLPAEISYRTADNFRHLDQLSIHQYWQQVGISGWLFKFLDVLLTREYGMEASQQSAINFLIMFEPPDPKDGHYEVFGQDHEVYKIKGGSQHLSDTLYERLKEQVVLLQKLIAIRPNAKQGYDLHFQETGSGLSADKGSNPVRESIIQVDQVIFAIPFTILRTIDFQVPMPEGKRKCIREMGYGNSCKFIMGMQENPWRRAGSQGYTFTDLSFGCGWDSSQRQSDHTASFTVFGGGNMAEWVRGTKEADIIARYLPDLSTIYPGADKEHNGRFIKFCWAGQPWSKAGYSSFHPGQWSTLAGWEATPVGNIYFAGEHVSREFQGYMNGAAQTGRVAAEQVAANWKKQAAFINNNYKQAI